MSEYVGIENALMLKRQSSLEIHTHSSYDFFAEHECSKRGYDLILFTHVFGCNDESNKKKIHAAMKHSRMNSRVIVIERFADIDSNKHFYDFNKIAEWIHLRLLKNHVAMYLLPYVRQSEAVELSHLNTALTADNLGELAFALHVFVGADQHFPHEEPKRLKDMINKLKKMDLYKKARGHYAMPIVDTMLIL